MSLLGGESYLRFLLSLIFVLGLILLAAWAARRFGLGGVLPSRITKERRLALVEVLPVDAKRRLVLLRRDDCEHLMLLSPTGDVVIESRIRERDDFATELHQQTEAAP